MNDVPKYLTEQTDAATYELVVRGHLDAGWAARLSVPNLTNQSNGTTILRGIVADQAALHGLLQRVRDLGLTLVSVVRVGPTANLRCNSPTTPERSK